MQETFLSAWRGRSGFDGGRSSAPGCTGSPPTSAWTCSGAAPGAPRRLACRGALAPAVPGPAARRGRAERRAARGGGHLAGDHLAGVPGRPAGPAAAAARGADRPRRARLAGQRDRLGARHQRRRGQQRPAAGPGDDAVAPAGPARRVVRAGAERGRSASCSSSSSRRTSGCDAEAAIAIAAPGPPGHHAAAAVLLRRAARRSGRCWPTRPRWANGGSSRCGPTGCRPRRATCAGRATAEFRAFKLDVLRIEAGLIAEITTFGADLFPAFGLRLDAVTWPACSNMSR